MELPSQVAHHCAQVLRYQQDDVLILFNGDGKDYQASIVELSKKKCLVKINSHQLVENESPLKIHLTQGIAKGDKMDLIIQKAVELGVNEFTPLFSERCNVKLDHKRLEKKHAHWQKVMLSACEQSGRARLMNINPAIQLQQLGQSNGLSIYLDPIARSTLSSLKKTNQIQLLIGPEGGFSELDIKKMQDNDLIGVSLGKRILRTETAGLAAVAVLQSLFGDF